MADDQRKPFTLRLHPSTLDALRTVAELEHRSINALVDDLIGDGLPGRIEALEQNTAATLSRLQSLRTATGQGVDG